MLDFDGNVHLVKQENYIFFSDAGFANDLFANCYVKNPRDAPVFDAMRPGGSLFRKKE